MRARHRSWATTRSPHSRYRAAQAGPRGLLGFCVTGTISPTTGPWLRSLRSSERRSRTASASRPCPASGRTRPTSQSNSPGHSAKQQCECMQARTSRVRDACFESRSESRPNVRPDACTSSVSTISIARVVASSGLRAGAGATAGGAVRSPLVPVRESERLASALAPFAATDDRSDYAGVVAVGDEVVPGDHAVEPAVPAIGRIAWARRKRPGGTPRWRRNARLNAYSLE
jgi:hypothetical protein